MPISGMLETARAAISLAEYTHNAELIAKLNETLVDITELIATNSSLRDFVRTLRDDLNATSSKLLFSEQLHFMGRLYHPVDADGRIGQPYCAACHPL